MRKKKRYVTNGAAITASIFVILDGISQYIELKEEDKPFWENLDVDRSLKAGISGLIIGGSIGYLLYRLHKWEERDLPFCPDNHLHQVLNTYNVQKDKNLFSKGRRLVNKLREEIYLKFGNNLICRPLDFGSARTKTAIGGSSDLDMMVPFKKSTYSLNDLYDFVYEFIVEKYSQDVFEVRKQRHSVGLTYDDGECCIHIDVVPARERNDFNKTGNVNILRRGEYLWNTPSYVKSNIWQKRNALINQPETRRMIKLVKVYREHTEIDLKSPIIEALVMEAMQKNNGYINNSIYNNWTLAMGYIADQLQVRNTLLDKSNSNNNLLENLSGSRRKKAANLILSDLEKIEESPNYLKEIFEIE